MTDNTKMMTAVLRRVVPHSRSALLALAGLFLLSVVAIGKAYAETYGNLSVLAFDLENASISGDYLSDNQGSYRFHYQGRGRIGAIVGKAPYDHYLRMRIDPDLGTCDDKDRSEIVFAEQIPFDSDYRYLGFRMMIPHGQPQKDPSGYLIFMQMWQSSPEQPFFTMSMKEKVDGSNAFHWGAGGKSGPGGSPGPLKTQTFTRSYQDLLPPFDSIGGDMLPGAWHSFVLRFKVEMPAGTVVDGKAVPTSNNGNVKLWKDGVVYAESMNLPLAYWNPTNGRFHYTIKLGMYKNCETSSGDKFDDDKYFEINFDEVRLGTTFAEVYPW